MSNNMSDDDANNNEDKEMEADVFFRDARDIMNQMSQKVGTDAKEDLQFRSFFGARMEISLMLWDMLGEGSLRPMKSRPKHLLWAMFFFKVYPREGSRCSAVDGLKGAIDPKTMWKRVWLFLERIAEQANHMVSLAVPLESCPRCLTLLHCPSSLSKPQINFESSLNNNVGVDSLFTFYGTNISIQQKGVIRKGNLFSSHKYAGKSTLHYKLKVDIGNLVRVKGPYLAGKWPIIKIFNSVLSHCLEPGECIEANNGYMGHPDKIK
jgi:hypothetical protein